MICERCGKVFEEDWRKDKRKQCRFCSEECSRKRHQSEETKKRIANSLRKKEQKKCKICGKLLGYNNKSGYCRKCKPPYKDHISSIRKSRKKRKEVLVAYKGGECEICGYNKCYSALEFHHIDPTSKEFQLTKGNCRTLEKDKKEVDKCLLLCANCHREVHAGLRDLKDR